MPEPHSFAYNVDRSTALYERPALAPQDAATFDSVKADVETSFSYAQIKRFLESLERAGLRIRDFEAVAGAGKLGLETSAKYAKLSPGDQGMVRELYLARLEQVDPALRKKFFKLYSY